MTEGKVIIVTGASRGIGLAISKFLLGISNDPSAHLHNKVILTARTFEALEKLKLITRDNSRVEIVAGDITGPELSQKLVHVALDKFGRLDGLVLNHGTLGEVKRIGNSDVDGWRKTFEINFFSCINLVQCALPALRKSHGRIIFTSSGAATGVYSTWGAYGSSKAAINHLTKTLGVEETEVTSIAIRPGIVDSDMQKEIREVHHDLMDEKDQQKFTTAHTQGKLLKPEQPGNVIAKLVVGAAKELSGQFLSWDDQALSEFQDPAN